jgi:flagellar protein FliS
MAIQNPAKAYQNSSVTTALPEELTLMLYNGAIKFIKQAKAAILEKKIEQAHHYNIRVQDILSELMITLDRSYPISEQLFSLYEYMNRRMVEANIKKDPEILDEVEGFFTQFRDTWKEAMALAKRQG